MDLEEIKQTEAWELYDKGRNFLRLRGVYDDTDKNYRMYCGNQWEGAKIEGIEQAQYNFIETIVNYKVSTINQNLWGINYSSENYDNKEFRKTAEETCKLLNKRAAKVWEKDQLDYKIREITEDSCVNDEGVMYVNYDKNIHEPVNEVLLKNDVQYGNENNSDIQSQPYIIISQRKAVSEVQEYAKSEGLSKKKIDLIVGDRDVFEQSGDDSKQEKDPNCTLITKLWKENGKVFYSKSTRYVDIKKKGTTGLTLYPLAHFNWREKKGNARGEGEVRFLIPNQLELNKTLARMLLSVKQNAYPTKVANIDKIANPAAINKIGGIIKVQNGATIDDVHKVFTTVAPSQMSGDVAKTISDLIGITRELKNSSDIATGGINPEDASGKAILAVQQASQQPMTKQVISLKMFIEDIARIWLDMWTTYEKDGFKLEEEKTDPNNETYIEMVDVPGTVLEALKAVVKVDITPKSPYDKYARELSLENLFKAGFFNVQRLSELEVYAKLLPDDSTMPKQDILKAVELMKEEQQKIAIINAQAQIMQQRASQFINNDVDAQAQQVADAANMINQEQ